MTDSSAFIGKKISHYWIRERLGGGGVDEQEFLLPHGVTSVTSPEKYTYT